jgi:hypothetical protein
LRACYLCLVVLLLLNGCLYSPLLRLALLLLVAASNTIKMQRSNHLFIIRHGTLRQCMVSPLAHCRHWPVSHWPVTLIDVCLLDRSCIQRHMHPYTRHHQYLSTRRASSHTHTHTHARARAHTHTHTKMRRRYEGEVAIGDGAGPEAHEAGPQAPQLAAARNQPWLLKMWRLGGGQKLMPTALLPS